MWIVTYRPICLLFYLFSLVLISAGIMIGQLTLCFSSQLISKQRNNRCLRVNYIVSVIIGRIRNLQRSQIREVFEVFPFPLWSVDGWRLEKEFIMVFLFFFVEFNLYTVVPCTSEVIRSRRPFDLWIIQSPKKLLLLICLHYYLYKGSILLVLLL